MATINTRVVLRNDIHDNWELIKDNRDLALLEGEMGVETDTGLFKIGKKIEVNGEMVLATWAELEYANEVDLSDVTNQVQVVDGTVNDLQAGKVVGDMAIVRSVINGNIKSHTAYVWNGTAWAAMDGNYNASNVYYDKNIQVTQSVGNVTTSNNAPVDLEFAGKNMEQIWQYLYATEDKSLSITQPSYSLSSSATSFSGELGTTFSDPTITLSFSDGEYEYGSKDSAGTTYTKANKAGVVWEDAVVTATGDKGEDGKYTTVTLIETDGNTTKTATFSVPDKVNKSATDTTKVNRYSSSKRTYTVSSTASCPASVRKPVTNLGNFLDSANVPTTDYSKGTKNTAAIAATDDAGKKSVTITVNAGWRGWFEGYKATGSELDVASLTSANIRGLGSAKNGNFSTSMSNVPSGTNQLLFACPAGKINFTLKDDDVTIDTGFTVAQSTPPAPWTVKHTTASVADAAGENSMTYDVFYCNDVGTIDKQNLTIGFTKK